MANKKRRNKKLRRQHAAALANTPQAPAQASTAASTGAGSAAVALPAPLPAQGSAPARQVPAYAAGVSGPRKGGGGAAATSTIDIDARVPYFAADLRRIGITAGLLFAVIVAASFFIR